MCVVLSIIGTVHTGSYMLHLLGAGGFRQTVCDTSFYSAPIIKFWVYAFVLSKVPEFGEVVFLFIVTVKHRSVRVHSFELQNFLSDFSHPLNCHAL